MVELYITTQNIQDFIKFLIIIIFTFKLNFKILNMEQKGKQLILNFLISMIIDILVIAIKNIVDMTIEIICLNIFIAVIQI